MQLPGQKRVGVKIRRREEKRSKLEAQVEEGTAGANINRKTEAALAEGN